MVKRMPDRKYAYFRDDQIVFLVTHDADKVSEDQLKEFKTKLENLLSGQKIRALPQVFSFPPLQNEDRERLAELRELEISFQKEDQMQRLAELRELVISLKEEDQAQRLAELHEFESPLKEEDRAQRLAELGERGILLKNEEQRQRLNKLHKHTSLLSNKEKNDDQIELRDIKKSWKDMDLSKLLAELQSRQDQLLDSQVPSDEQPKLFDRAFFLLRCDLDTPADLVSVPLHETIQSLRKKLGEELRDRTARSMKIEDVSPNWLMSVSSQGGATGGPGALPMPFSGDPKSAPYEFAQLKKILKEAKLDGTGNNVDVAILDTAPCGHALVLAAKEWAGHPLIDTLLGPSGKLHLYPATYKELKRMASTSINKHDYPMTDHGLFAAGIVHSIVPDAEIHLIEVLNEFGVGDLASLAEGLAKAYDQIYKPESGRRLVVNCSWMLELPISDLHCSASEEDAEEYAFEQGILRFVQEEKDQALTLRTICNNLDYAGRQVVAAAGNDKQNAKVRKDKKLQKLLSSVRAGNIDGWVEYLLEYLRGDIPEARYPAAFVSVIGVGALPKGRKRDLAANEKYESSNYSNLGDKPAGNAILTLGGEEGEDGEGNKGVLGLFLGSKFPKLKDEEKDNERAGKSHKREIQMYERPDESYWAWWAGTSFAAPILTGAIAAVLSNTELGIRRTQHAVDKLKSKHVIELDGTTSSEDVMYVEQG
jgi:hypothetical protein